MGFVNKLFNDKIRGIAATIIQAVINKTIDVQYVFSEQCQLPCDVQPKAYARAIADLIKGKHKDYNISDNLRSYFK